MEKAYKKEAVIQENASFFLFSNIRTDYRVSGSSINIRSVRGAVQPAV